MSPPGGAGAGHRGVVLASELVGLAEAIAIEAGPLWRGGGGPVRLGVPDDAKAAVVAAIAGDWDGATLLVASTPARAQATAEEVGLFAGGFTVLRLPERELLPYEFARDDDVVRVERGRALAALSAGQRALVVASWASLSEHCPGPEAERQGVELRVGEGVAPLTLVGQLEAIGYEVGAVAERQGTVARHGGVVDVFPVGAEHPFRLEFFGDEIESIRRVDVATQRSVERVESLHVGPAGTGTTEAKERARALLEVVEPTGDGSEEVIEQLAIVGEGNRTDYVGFFEGLLFEHTALDHIAAGTRVVLDDEEDGAESLGQLLEHQSQARAEHEERGIIPRGLGPLNADISTVRGRLAEMEPLIHLQRFGDEAFGAKRAPMRAAPAFAGKLRVLVQQADAWAKQGKAVVVATQQALRLADLMDEEGVPTRLVTSVGAEPEAGTVSLIPVAVSGGFLLGEHLMFITDAEVFGFRKRRRPTRTRQGLKSDLVTTLEPGDYLVHADHGIARFGGMVRRTTDGATREYLELQYAEGDRLLVPADQLEAVSRYIGPTDRPPSLTRLGSQEWVRAKRRVRQSVLELAQDLVELYAKREVAKGFAFPADNPWQMEMEAAFPFVETPDQLAAISEVKADMEQPRPMDRLICGDVGYGKTEVAVRAAFKAVTAGKQVAVLVPTTVLAEQHGHTFRERTAGFPIRVEVLSRFRSHEEQDAIVKAIAKGEVDIAIGTHRLIQKDVQYKDLGMVVIDEEQRFGVSHKEQLKKMREEVDVLTLSATPIPRTLQMSLVGIRDMSTVMSPPEERTPIRTYVTEWDNEVVREAILRELERGGQVYFVHNRVQGIERIMTRLRELVPEARIVIGHGQMPEEQLERVMAEFGAGDHDVLLCTTIIESGLDIPNVNTIIINDANRLGLAQLYQLRGRVGRGANRAYAYLLYDRNRAISETAQKRLEAIFEATELGAGFQIALRDLEIRGAGNVLGTAQSGHIAAVGFDMYAKLVAEAVTAVKQVFRPEERAAEPPLPPAPTIDLPVSAHIPETYVDDMHSRLAVYQRISLLESAEEVSAMQEELRDRYGPVPPAVEHLLFVALVKTVARRARVENIQTTEQLIHIRGRSGITDGQRQRVEGLGLKGIMVGPNQVRIDRLAAGEGWMPLLVRVLRAMAVRE